MGLDPLRDLLAGLDIRGLHIDRADAELLVAEAAFVVRRHVVLDEEGVAIDPADQIRLVAPGVEIAVADLSIVIRAHRVVALADMDEHMDVVGQTFDRHVDDVDGGADLFVARRREIRLVDLDMLAARLGQLPEVLVQQLAEVGHHL